MTQESKSGWICCLCERQQNSIVYLLRYIPSEEFPEQEIPKIENKYPKLRGKLSQYFKTKTSDIKKAEKFIDDELNSQRFDQEIAREFYDQENHDLPFICATESFGLKLRQLMKEASKESKQNEDLAGLIGGFLLFFILLCGFGFFFSQPKQFPNIQNDSGSSTNYQTCANGGGGRACKKLTKTYRDCENNGGGKACEKLIK